MCVAELIREFCDEVEDVEVYENYSGRGMFGRTCIGIQISGNSLEIIVKLCDYLRDNGISSVDDALGTVCQDSLGLDMIVYFPFVS